MEEKLNGILDNERCGDVGKQYDPKQCSTVSPT